MIERVLIATEDSRERMLPIVEHAVVIVAALDADVTLLHVYTESEFDRRLDEFEMSSADPSDIAKRNQMIREAAEVFHKRDVDVSVDAAVGDPATMVIKYVEEHGVDHVFLGGRRRSPSGKALLGSVAQDVLLSVDVPCTVKTS